MARTQQEPRPRQAIDPLFSQLGFDHEPTLAEVKRLYPQKQEPVFAATRLTLANGLRAYSDGLDELNAQPVIVSAYQRQQVQEPYLELVSSAEKLNFPANVLAHMSGRFLLFAFENPLHKSEDVRKAARDMGLAIGGSEVRIAKAYVIKDRYKEALEAIRKGDLNPDHVYVKNLAKDMLEKLGVDLIEEPIPSVTEEVTIFVQKNGRKVGMAAAAATVASTLFAAPNMAAAAETTSSTSQSISVNPLADQVTISLPSTQQEIQTSPSVTTTPNTSTPDTAIAAPPIVTMTPDNNSDVQKATLPAPNETNQNATDVKAAAPVIALPDQSTDASNTTPATPENPLTALTPDTQELTANQEIAQGIITTLNTDGDVVKASSNLRLNFRIPTALVSNSALVQNVRSILPNFQNVMWANGHSDTNYNNETLLAFAILDAAANDGSVLQAPDPDSDQASEVADLAATIKAPTDHYKAQLFNKYLDAAKATLEANNSNLLSGIDSGSIAQYETMYAYVLMASVSDADQATQIQAFEDADKKAAEEATPPAASSPSTPSSPEKSNTQETIGHKALQELIDHQTDPAKKRMFQAFQFYIDNDFTPTQSAAIIGNIGIESAHTFSASKLQIGGGDGHGLFQHEKGRFQALEDYAASQGTEWNDFHTQLAFSLVELHSSRSWALKPLTDAKSLYDATTAFMKDFETPDVVIHGTEAKIEAQASLRTSVAKTALDAYDKEVSALQHQAEKQKAPKTSSLTAHIKKVIDTVTNAQDTYIGPHFADHYAAGNCTEFAFDIRKVLGLPVGSNWGNAGNWGAQAEADNYVVNHTPAPGALASTWTVTTPSNNAGHVVLVVEVYKDGSFLGAEMNHEGLNKVDYRHFTAAQARQFTFTHGKKSH